MKPTLMARADFVTGIVLLALGVAVLVESLRMPTFAHLGVNPYTVPGIVPAMLGVVIGVLGAVLLVRAGRAGGWRLGLGEVARDAVRSAAVHRTLITLFLTLAYGAVLVGRVRFWLATFLFVLAFVVVFEWPRGRTVGGHLFAVGTAVLLAAAVSAIVTYVFQHVFLVRLP
jgi:hypothetical protein